MTANRLSAGNEIYPFLTVSMVNLNYFCEDDKFWISYQTLITIYGETGGIDKITLA